MNMNIKIIQFTPEVTPVIREDNIKAFVTWTFQTEQGIWKIYGGTIRLKQFGENQKPTLTYDCPAYKSGIQYKKSFYIDNVDLYKQLCEETLSNYYDLTGQAHEGRNLVEEEDDEAF